MSIHQTVESVATNGHMWQVRYTDGTVWPTFWTSEVEAGFVRTDIVPKAGDDTESGIGNSGVVTFIKINGVLVWSDPRGSRS